LRSNGRSTASACRDHRSNCIGGTDRELLASGARASRVDFSAAPDPEKSSHSALQCNIAHRRQHVRVENIVRHDALQSALVEPPIVVSVR